MSDRDLIRGVPIDSGLVFSRAVCVFWFCLAALLVIVRITTCERCGYHHAATAQTTERTI